MMMDYVEFGSKISFFEFIQDEFKEPHFIAEDYREEFDILQGVITIEKLEKILEKNPETFDIFEEFFQISRFTNTQFIHFLSKLKYLFVCKKFSKKNNNFNHHLLSH